VLSIENILDKYDNVYVWEDGKTLDVCHENTSFIEILKHSKCLACDFSLLSGNESYIAQISDSVKGARIKCKQCNQKYFLHVLVSMISANPDR
jgi:hypothetical protein